MNIYDQIIEGLINRTGTAKPVKYTYDPEDTWETSDHYELILQKDTAFELGGMGKTAVNFTCVTDKSDFFSGDEILIYGKELCELKEDSSYARVTIILTDDINSDASDTEALYRTVQSMDFVKYHVFPKGYMMRTSSQNNREQVRISKKALRNGLSFRHIGNVFIKNYKKNKLIKNVKVLFITAGNADYEGLKKDAVLVNDITKSLSKILEGMPADCSSCGLKDICDEVEGLRELHFGQNGGNS